MNSTQIFLTPVPSAPQSNSPDFYGLESVFFGIRVCGSLCFIEIQSICFSWPSLSSVARLYHLSLCPGHPTNNGSGQDGLIPPGPNVTHLKGRQMVGLHIKTEAWLRRTTQGQKQRQSDRLCREDLKLHFTYRQSNLEVLRQLEDKQSL